jgi:hypothetical protein
MATRIQQKAEAATTDRNDFKKADGFFNLKIKTTKGDKSFGKTGIALYADNPVHAKVMAMIESGTEPTAILGLLTATFQRANNEDDADFELVL